MWSRCWSRIGCSFHKRAQFYYTRKKYICNKYFHFSLNEIAQLGHACIFIILCFSNKAASAPLNGTYSMWTVACNCESFKGSFRAHCSLYAQLQTADHMFFFLGDCSYLFQDVNHIQHLHELTETSGRETRKDITCRFVFSSVWLTGCSQ